MLASFVIKRWFWWQLIMLKVWLQQKPILTTNSLALLNYFAARTSVTCDAKNMCDKADMNLGKGNIVIWYYCIVCGRERAMDSMGFTRNSYGWVPAATQLAVSLATVIQSMRYLWPVSYGFCRKIHCLKLEIMSCEGEFRGEFRPRQTRQLPRAVDLKGRLLSCQSY